MYTPFFAGAHRQHGGLLLPLCQFLFFRIYLANKGEAKIPICLRPADYSAPQEQQWAWIKNSYQTNMFILAKTMFNVGLVSFLIILCFHHYISSKSTAQKTQMIWSISNFFKGTVQQDGYL